MFMRDFTGFIGFSVLSSSMRKGVLVAVGFLAVCCLPVLAEQNPFKSPIKLTLAPSDLYSGVDTVALVHSLMLTDLINMDGLGAENDLSRMASEPADFLPIALIVPSEEPRENYYIYQQDYHPADGKDTKDGPFEALTPVSKIHYGGEVGFLYGSSGSRFGGDVMHGYVIGEVSDDKTHITVGASYEESNYRFPHRGR